MSDFTVTSWNIQADRTRGEGHWGINTSYIPEVLSKLQELDSDILCLQEMQKCKRQIIKFDCKYCKSNKCLQDHVSLFEEELYNLGYDGEHLNRNMINTLGIYFKKNKFDIIKKNDIEKMFNKNFKKFNGKKDNKGILIAILKHKISNKIIIITNLHLSLPNIDEYDKVIDIYKQQYELYQIQHKLYNIRKQYKNSALILAGDFNSLPYSKGIYNNITNQAGEWKLESSYKNIIGKELNFTNWKKKEEK